MQPNREIVFEEIIRMGGCVRTVKRQSGESNMVVDLHGTDTTDAELANLKLLQGSSPWISAARESPAIR